MSSSESPLISCGEESSSRALSLYLYSLYQHLHLYEVMYVINIPADLESDTCNIHHSTCFKVSIYSPRKVECTQRNIAIDGFMSIISRQRKRTPRVM